MKQPKTNTQEILYTLIEKGEVSIFDFPYLSGFRTRVSELKLTHGINIQAEKKQAKNKFNNVYSYALHKLVDVESAKKVYETLSKNN